MDSACRLWCDTTMKVVMSPWLALVLLLQTIAPVPVEAADAPRAAANSVVIAPVVESEQEQMLGHCQDDTAITNTEPVPPDDVPMECCEDCCDCECSLACSMSLVALLSPAAFGPTRPERRTLAPHVSPLHTDTRHRLFRPPIHRVLS